MGLRVRLAGGAYGDFESVPTGVNERFEEGVGANDILGMWKDLGGDSGESTVTAGNDRGGEDGPMEVGRGRVAEPSPGVCNADLPAHLETCSWDVPS